MTLSEDQVREGAGLLSGALENPFCAPGDGDAPIRQWFAFLVAHLPLVCFNTDAFEALDHLPSTDPLGRLLRSVLSDEGWQGWVPDPDAVDSLALSLNLAARRAEMGRADARSFPSCVVRWEEDTGQPRVASGGNLRLLTEADCVVELDNDGNRHAYSPFDEIGRQFVSLIEALEAEEPGTEEADHARQAIWAFVRATSSRLRPGRPTEGTTTPILRAIHTELSDLLRVLQEAGGEATPSDATRRLLAQLRVEDPEAQDRWSVRLALPPLSARELSFTARYEEDEWLTPRGTAVFILSRRFSLEAPHVARRITGSDAEEAFRLRQSDYPF